MPEFSEAALNVYLLIQPPQVTGTYRGEPYAIALADEHDQLIWYPATEREASEHGQRFGWGKVAAVWRHPSQRNRH